MASVNKVIIVGNLGRDPETRYMPSGDAMTSITVATTDSWKDKATGEIYCTWIENGDWKKVKGDCAGITTANAGTTSPAEGTTPETAPSGNQTPSP